MNLTSMLRLSADAPAFDPTAAEFVPAAPAHEIPPVPALASSWSGVGSPVGTLDVGGLPDDATLNSLGWDGRFKEYGRVLRSFLMRSSPTLTLDMARATAEALLSMYDLQLRTTLRDEQALALWSAGMQLQLPGSPTAGLQLGLAGTEGEHEGFMVSDGELYGAGDGDGGGDEEEEWDDAAVMARMESEAFEANWKAAAAASTAAAVAAGDDDAESAGAPMVFHEPWAERGFSGNGGAIGVDEYFDEYRPEPTPARTAVGAGAPYHGSASRPAPALSATAAPFQPARPSRVSHPVPRVESNVPDDDDMSSWARPERKVKQIIKARCVELGIRDDAQGTAIAEALSKRYMADGGEHHAKAAVRNTEQLDADIRAIGPPS